MIKNLLLSAGIGALSMVSPVFAQAQRAYDERYSTAMPGGYGDGWSGSDDIGEKVERPTAPQEYESTDGGRNVPLSQRVDPENPASPSMSGTAD